MSEICVASTNQINAQYDDMTLNLTKSPKDEAELVTLKNYIQEHEVNLSRLDKQVNQVYQFLLILEENSFDFGVRRKKNKKPNS